MPLLLNQLQATQVSLFTPWTGVWFADVDLVLDETKIVPSGSCLLTIGTTVFKGTIDPTAAGAFTDSCRVRVLGGGGGWSKQVMPLHLHNPAGLLSTAAYSATAAEVLETVVDVAPDFLGFDFVRTMGPASRVFGAKDWYVNALGITTVGPRLPVPYDPTNAEIVKYDPKAATVELASVDPIVPGTIVLDPIRIPGGPLTVRDVLQVWQADGGAIATCWCGENKGSRLQTALANIVTEKAGLPYLRTYEYRVVLEDPATEDLTLQIVNPAKGVPDALPFSMWMGVPGVGAKVTPGSIVLVQFGGDPTTPRVVGFKHGQDPILLEFGQGATSPIGLSIGLQAQIAALQIEVAALGTWIAQATAQMVSDPVHFAPFAAAMVPNGATVATAVAVGAAAVAAGVVPATSTMVVSR